MTGNTGAVTYTTTVSSPSVSVAANGAVTSPGSTSPGAYTVSGTDADTASDTGTWTFTLTVAPTTVTGFNQPRGVALTPNGGSPTLPTPSSATVKRDQHRHQHRHRHCYRPQRPVRGGDHPQRVVRLRDQQRLGPR